MVRVRLDGVVKRFKDTVAVNGIDLDVGEGEFMVLLGPSGCGKTTTLRLIAGLEKADAGRILFDDKEVTYLPPKERNVSMVFQSYALWPHMKVYDNIAFPLKIKGVPQSEMERRVRWTAELLQITELLDRYPHQLSGGQRQRVAVARAIVVSPDVLLMDEPLSNLDALLRVRMRSEIKKLQRRIKVTTIYVTHDQVEAMTMGDRIAVMNSGKILQVGKPQDVYLRPKNLFVAGFVGSPQMNFIEARVEIGKGLVLLKSGGFQLGLRGEFIDLLRKYDGSEVIIGIRPEHLRLGKAISEEGLPIIKGTVDFIEALGSDIIVHVDMGPKIIVVKASGIKPPAIGESVNVFFELSNMHLFDKRTEELIL